MVLERGTHPSNFRGVRVHVNTGYDRVEEIRRASRNGRVSDLPPEIRNSPIRHFCVAVQPPTRALPQLTHPYLCCFQPGFIGGIWVPSLQRGRKGGSVLRLTRASAGGCGGQAARGDAGGARKVLHGDVLRGPAAAGGGESRGAAHGRNRGGGGQRRTAADEAAQPAVGGAAPGAGLGAAWRELSACVEWSWSGDRQPRVVPEHGRAAFLDLDSTGVQ
jgi:hypothetical protein